MFKVFLAQYEEQREDVQKLERNVLEKTKTWGNFEARVVQAGMPAQAERCSLREGADQCRGHFCTL